MNKITKTILIGISSIIIPLTLSAQTPVLFYDFNDSGPKYKNKGSAKLEAQREGKNQKVGAAGTGVSGKEADLAWDATENTTAGAAEPANNSRIRVPGTDKQLNGYKAFTVVMWYTSEQKLDSAVRYFGKTDSATKQTKGFVVRSLAPKNMGGKAAMELRLGDGSTSQDFVSDYFPKGKGYNVWGPENEWVFMAITWDGAIVKFYVGNTKEPVAPAGARRYSGKVVPETKASLFIGNTAGSNRGLDGKVDNFRFYDEALDMDNLEKLRAGDVAGR